MAEEFIKFDPGNIESNTEAESIPVSHKSKKQKVDVITTHACCDLVFTGEDGVKYIAGTNQLFPIFRPDFCNGCKYPVSLYLYTALKWKDLFYTDSGDAVCEEDDPDAVLGYDHGIDIISYKNATPCLVSDELGNRKEKPLTVDQWCRLSHNGILTKEFLPKLWIESEMGHEFWTPDKGIIKALPVDIPMVLHSAEAFCEMVSYNRDAATMLRKITMALNMFTGGKMLYVGFTPSLTTETETNMIEATAWSKTHSRRIGIVRAKNNCLDALSMTAARALAMSLANNGFEQEEIFA